MIRTNTLVEDYEVISQFDDAVDKSVEDFDHKWKMYRDGMGEAPLKPGEKPTRFKMRHLSSVERAWLLEVAQSEDKGLYVAAVQLALTGVRDALDHEGKPLRVDREATTVGAMRLLTVKKQSLEALPLEVIFELGSLAMERSAPRPS